MYTYVNFNRNLNHFASAFCAEAVSSCACSAAESNNMIVAMDAGILASIFAIIIKISLFALPIFGGLVITGLSICPV